MSSLNKIHLHFLKVLHLWSRGTKVIFWGTREACSHREERPEKMGTSHSSFLSLCLILKSLSLRPEDRTLEVFSCVALPPKSYRQLAINPILLTPQIRGIHNFLPLSQWPTLLGSSSFFGKSSLSLPKLTPFLVFCLLNLNIPKGRGGHITISFPLSFI